MATDLQGLRHDEPTAVCSTQACKPQQLPALGLQDSSGQALQGSEEAAAHSIAASAQGAPVELWRYRVSSCQNWLAASGPCQHLCCLLQTESLQSMAALRAELLVMWVRPREPAKRSDSVRKQAQLIWKQCSLCAAQVRLHLHMSHFRHPCKLQHELKRFTNRL